MHDTITCMEFPCSFPLKVMGQKSDAFEKAVRGILSRHLPGIAVEYESRPSGTGKYLAITATFTATSREQLDALYRELNAHELVVMTL
ncbi:MAG: DUF493 domain-containing protein [Nitrospirota bacterium]